jgi:hypothetical protein
VRDAPVPGDLAFDDECGVVLRNRHRLRAENDNYTNEKKYAFHGSPQPCAASSSQLSLADGGNYSEHRIQTAFARGSDG